MNKNKYRKALKNYASGAKINDIIAAIQQLLVDFGASGVGFGYEDSRISGVYFKIQVQGNDQMITIPLKIERVAQVLRNQRQFKNDEHTYRVALANVRDWLDAQLALLTTEMVDLPEIFLPYMQSRGGQTLYEIMKEKQFLLPEKS